MRITVLTVIISIVLHACDSQTRNNTQMNTLIHSASPYLQQHANNPVHWQEWGPEALAMAKELNKPLIISIGYAACHWCHVMEHESFSDKEVAEFMNENFICIKVDREERPDIDQIYMDAVHLISGQGGWPLNAFAMPDGRPFYAGTYFPKQKWLSVMKQISDLYKNEFSQVETYANELMQGINNSLISEIDSDSELVYSVEQFLELKSQWIKSTDFKDGGFNRAPKFPLPSSWEFLLEYYYISNDQEALDPVIITLDKMAAGGIYDQIGGGFARYSVDSYWKVPHFEKMLYDNAQLVSLYSHAYKITKDERYKEVVEQTLDFIKRELTDDNGGFYSSLNADSEGVEGKFYVWTYDEFMETIDGTNKELIAEYFQVTQHGNWEDEVNILLAHISKEQFAKEHNLSRESFDSFLQVASNKLLDRRSLRERPSTDDKILTAWNAMMITGYLDAYLALGNEDYLATAISGALFIEKNMLRKDGSLYRSHMNGKSGIDAFLDDYALLADAYLKLYSITFNFKWLALANNLIKYTNQHFYDQSTGMYFYTSDNGEELITRKHELSDNVIPSSNSIMAKVLFKAGHILSQDSYLETVDAMLKQILDKAVNSGIWYSNWVSLLGMRIIGVTEVAITGKNHIKNSLELQCHYLPYSLFVGGNKENIPLLKGRVSGDNNLIYVCRNKVCNLPDKDAKTALKTIKSYGIVK